MKRRLGIALGLMILGVVLKFATERLPVIDEKGEEYIKSTLIKTAVAYGITRGVNALVSMLKDADIRIPILAKIPVGKILDPIDDMTERASDLLVKVIAIQIVMLISLKILQTFGSNLFMILFIILGILYLFASIANVRVAFGHVLKLTTILLFVRIAVPLTGIVNEVVITENPYFKERVENAMNVLGFAKSEVDKVSRKLEKESAKDSGLFEKFFNLAGDIFEKLGGMVSSVLNIPKLIWKFITQGDQVINALLDIFSAYLFVFVFQIVVIPFTIFFGVSMIWKMEFMGNHQEL